MLVSGGDNYFSKANNAQKFVVVDLNITRVFSGPNTFNENETICKFEIMDGAPVRGESIPIRVFLAGNDLTPTFRDVGGKFSVRYFVSQDREVFCILFCSFLENWFLVLFCLIIF